MIENTVECLEKKLSESEEKLRNLRNFQKELGSKIIVEDAWRRYLRDQLVRLKSANSNSVQNCTQEDAKWT